MGMAIDSVPSVSSAYVQSLPTRHVMLVGSARNLAQAAASASASNNLSVRGSSTPAVSSQSSIDQSASSASALANASTSMSSSSAIQAVSFTDNVATTVSEAAVSAATLPTTQTQTLAAESLNYHQAQYELQTLGTTPAWTNAYYAVNLSPVEMYTKAKAPLDKVTAVAAVQAAQNDFYATT